MRTDNNPRTFYVGKKKAGRNSKFGLVGALKSAQSDPLSKPSSAEIDLLGIRKGSVSKELALFNSLFPQSTAEQRKDFLEGARRDRLGITQPLSAEAGRPGAGVDDAMHTRMSVKDIRIDSAAAALPTGESRSRTASRTMQELAGTAGTAKGMMPITEQECEELDLDPDVVIWQNFTIDTMHKEKTGPKKILPVLIMKNEAGASSRRFAVNKSKRWGSGVLLQLAAQAEEDPIDGPPTYLEIFKGAERRKLREKDRRRITDELHALVK
jgi:hypothetical protein